MFSKFSLLSVSSILALTLAACSSSTTAKDVDMSNLASEPVIFSVSDADSEIILYPTFHILPEGVEWESDVLTAALERTEEIWYEIPVGAETDPAFQQLTMELGVDPDMPLSKSLDAETYADVEAAATKMGFPMQNLEPMRPWMASIVIPVVQMMQSGYNPALGVEPRLQAMVTDKPIKAFETAEQQLRFLADMPLEDQIAMLKSTVEDLDEGKEMLDKMVVAWSTGDMDFLKTEMVDEMKADYPGVYDVMIKKRNDAWVERLDAEMKGSGVDFVAVGAAHLIGEDGVPEQLLEKGYTVKVLTKAK
jgi:uncharacterized protein YbaP (TraB family)